jgi:hypothetical protein
MAKPWRYVTLVSFLSLAGAFTRMTCVIKPNPARDFSSEIIIPYDVLTLLI